MYQLHPDRYGCLDVESKEYGSRNLGSTVLDDFKCDGSIKPGNWHQNVAIVSVRPDGMHLDRQPQERTRRYINATLLFIEGLHQGTTPSGLDKGCKPR